MGHTNDALKRADEAGMVKVGGGPGIEIYVSATAIAQHGIEKVRQMVRDRYEAMSYRPEPPPRAANPSSGNTDLTFL